MVDALAPASASPSWPQHAGVRVEERAGLALATIMARAGASAAAIGAALGVTAPESPRRAGDAALALIGTGPGAWLALAENAGPDWAETLAARVRDLASLADQSGGYVVLRLSGPRARDLIARGAFMDLRADRFPPGAAATTAIAHMGAILWCVDATTFEIALFRSYAQSFADWIEAAMAGLDIGARAHV